MKSLKKTGMVIFLIALTIFTLTPFLGPFKMTEEIMIEQLSEQELSNLADPFKANILDKEYGTSFAFSRDVMAIYNEINEEYRKNEQWDQIMYTAPKDLAFKLAKASSNGVVASNKWMFFLLTFILAIAGSLLYIVQDLKLLGPAGIKNDGVYHDSSMNRGWVGIVTAAWLITFYVILYFHPYAIVNMTYIVDPIKELFKEGAQASQWFLYGLLYCIAMLVMGIRMYIKYRHNKYQTSATTYP